VLQTSRILQIPLLGICDSVEDDTLRLKQVSRGMR
jgi:hypothetical protein